LARLVLIQLAASDLSPGAGYLSGRDFRLRPRLPNAPLGTRLPVTLRLLAAGPDGQTSGDVGQVEVIVAELRYLPVTP
jgi:hypothetical protein